MPEYHHTIQTPERKEIHVTVRRDKRLKKSSRWQRQPDGTILLRIPQRYLKRDISALLKNVSKQVARQAKRRKGRTDADLQARAQSINKAHFGNQLEWQAIRWVGNMQHRLGSCTSGGVTDGHIRISNKMRGWPGWVVDYVIAHELTHLRHPNHSKAFWDDLTAAYPKTEQARGFIKGVGFAAGQPYSEDG